jgi:hypothetical protein
MTTFPSERLFKIIGIISALGFMIVIVPYWVYSDMIEGYTYISFGEPIAIIKYAEWTFGFIGILTLISELKNTIKQYTL